MTTPDGLVVVDKPGGLTSHDVVARTRRLAGTRRVGHAGTLDPMATGVLVLGVNRATRLLGHLTLTEKAYDATIRLGASTVTDDAEGDVVETADASGVTDEALRSGIARLTGDIAQVPSAVSAVKIDGKRAYKRVREGEDVVLPPRPIIVRTFEVVASRPDGPFLDVDVRVECSSGTYVRALARDLGARLGVGGHLSALRRTAVGPYTLADARTLDQLGEEFAMMPIATAARAAFSSLELDDSQAADVRVGRSLDLALDTLTAVFAPDGEFLALYEPRAGAAKAVAVFV